MGVHRGSRVGHLGDLGLVLFGSAPGEQPLLTVPLWFVRRLRRLCVFEVRPAGRFLSPYFFAGFAGVAFLKET